MVGLVLKIFDWMASHRGWCLCSFLLATLFIGASMTRLTYKEDIRDFLPLDDKQQQAMAVYEQQAQANRFIAIVDNPDTLTADPAFLIESVEAFVAAVEARDTARWVSPVRARMDFSQMEEQQQRAYRQLPYLLDVADYQRMDSLLRHKDFVTTQLQKDRERLLLPTASLLVDEIRHDPLDLFSPVLSLLRDTAMMARFDLYDGYLLTADHRRALLFIDSPFGATETASNARLLSLLESAGAPFSIRITGGPAIAVANASQIRTDSLLSISLAVVLILLLLWFTIRRLRHILLIAVAIAWGWLFALGCLALVHREVSIIVIGISSVIVGIAVNYPLHFISHLSHTPDVRQTLRDIAKPLVVGNITTVGAFLALVPLRSVALRDLGLFSSFLLIGTILFTLLWLPHLLGEFVLPPSTFRLPSSAFRLPSSTFRLPPAVTRILFLLLTLFFGYHSLSTTFDTDLSHINYMSPEQRADMQWLGHQYSSADTARQAALAARFSSSPDECEARLALWQSWISAHRDSLLATLRAEASEAGFASDAFDPFCTLLTHTSDMAPPSPSLLPPSSSLLTSLSDEFNYIGWACACIVFFFLWLSFRSLPLALLSFLPMALSWLWILGIMSLLGIQFNIVNIILATFIFGQGDDYTIFMTEGAVYEYVHRRPMLASYKRSILLSALIMFIGIGSLIVARHPALHSLAVVTIVGMFSVVLMAFTIPPVVFRWFVRYRKFFRFPPFTK